MSGKITRDNVVCTIDGVDCKLMEVAHEETLTRYHVASFNYSTHEIVKIDGDEMRRFGNSTVYGLENGLWYADGAPVCVSVSLQSFMRHEKVGEG